MQLDKTHLDRLDIPDTRDEHVFNLNISERAKRKVSRQDYMELCLRAKICWKCGEEQYMVDLEETSLCSECFPDRVAYLKRRKK